MTPGAVEGVYGSNHISPLKRIKIGTPDCSFFRKKTGRQRMWFASYDGGVTKVLDKSSPKFSKGSLFLFSSLQEKCLEFFTAHKNLAATPV